MAEAIERIGLRGALVASTVSSGIARDMGKEYQLERPLLVFRNTPAREDVAFRPCGERMMFFIMALLCKTAGWRTASAACSCGARVPPYPARTQRAYVSGGAGAHCRDRGRARSGRICTAGSDARAGTGCNDCRYRYLDTAEDRASTTSMRFRTSSSSTFRPAWPSASATFPTWRRLSGSTISAC